MDKMLLPTAFVQQLHRHVRKIQHLTPTGKLVNMAMAFLVLSTGTVLGNLTTPGRELSLLYYDGLCPGFGLLATAKFQNLTDSLVAPKIAADPGLAPALLRLAFHDCFVEGCDASVLLNTTGNSTAEKDAFPNLTLRGFELIDAVKAALELVCPGVFSCADIVQEVALAAQRYVNQTSPKGNWILKYGRRDGRVSLDTEALQFIPSPFWNYTTLVASFGAKGLNKFDLVALSGAHTFGVAHCITIFPRLYNFFNNGSGTDPALNATYAAILKVKCPPESPFNVVNLDVTTPIAFDNKYYDNIINGNALFVSDNALKSDNISIIVDEGSNFLFLTNFAISMKKMTEVQVKLYPNGEIRSNCALRNA